MNFMLLVARAISHSFAALTREILFLPLEHKIHIFSPPCNILYIHCFEENNKNRIMRRLRLGKQNLMFPSGPVIKF